MNQHLFILAESRCGSTWLQETLNSHSDITMETELLNPHHRIERYSAFLQRLHKINPLIKKLINRTICINNVEELKKELKKHETKYSGCKILFRQLLKQYYTNNSINMSSQFFHHFPECRIIFLERKNILKAETSMAMCAKYNLFHTTKNVKETGSVYLNPVFLYKRLELRQAYKNTTRTLLSKLQIPTISTSYEDMFGNPQDFLDKASKFLDIQSEWKYSQLKKIAKRPLSEYVENWHEIRNFLKGTPHEEFCTE